MDAPEETAAAVRLFRIGDWRVEPLSCRLVRGDTEIALEPKVMELLAFLASRNGRVATKPEIIDAVWGGRYVVESVLTRAMSLLRAALGDNARHPTYIETIPRRGYRFIAPVEWLEPRRAGDAAEPVRGAPWLLQSDAGPIRLPQGETVIGRGDDVDLFFESVDVSRHHARITVSCDDALIEDLGSKNGTLLNGRPVSEPEPLSDLDVVVVGSVRPIVRTGTAIVETETAES